jgi:quinol monooxygenase YgiN
MAKEAAREKVRQAITAHLDVLINAQLANACGLQYLVYRDKQTGKFERVRSLEDVDQDAEVIEVWEKDPSVQAFTDLLNRAIDRPKEQVQEIEIRADNTTALDRAKERSLLKLKGTS